MVRTRKMARETDKTDRKEGREAERSLVHTGAAQVLGELAVICVSAPVRGCVPNRYDVKQKTNVVVFLLFFFSFSPTTSFSQMGNDSLAFGYLERGSACGSICTGPSVNT